MGFSRQEYWMGPPPVRAPEPQLAVEQPLTGGQWNLPEKDIPRLKKKPQQDGRRGTIMINQISNS